MSNYEIAQERLEDIVKDSDNFSRYFFQAVDLKNKAGERYYDILAQAVAVSVAADEKGVDDDLGFYDFKKDFDSDEFIDFLKEKIESLDRNSKISDICQNMSMHTVVYFLEKHNIATADIDFSCYGDEEIQNLEINEELIDKTAKNEEYLENLYNKKVTLAAENKELKERFEREIDRAIKSCFSDFDAYEIKNASDLQYIDNFIKALQTHEEFKTITALLKKERAKYTVA